MARIVLTDAMWDQLKALIRKFGGHIWKNDRQIMEAILWKLRTGAQWREIPEKLCPWKTAYNRFNRWSKKGMFESFFLSYEDSLIRSGYSSMEAMLECINMRVELGVATKEQLAVLEEASQQRFIWPPTRTDIRLILKSLGVTSTTVKLRKL
jgi:hypothetical protein